MKKIKLVGLFLFVMAFIVIGIEVEASSELSFPMHVIQKNAPDSESNVIVFFGDGFTEEEQGKFIEVVRKKAKVLMEIEPLKMHKESFNIYAMQVVSKESGSSVDVGKNPPTPYKDTYFNIRFNYAGMYRLTNFFDGGGKRAQALYNEIENKYLDAGGKIFHSTVIINSNEYGGSGGAISITSLDSGTNTMILHEAAHSFAGLRDEYWTGTGEGPNKTKNNDLTTIKWKEFVGFRGIGAFPYGKASDQALWFKPVAGGCLMETLYTNSFCQVCRHEVFNKINLPRIKIFKELYIAEPIFTTESTNKEVVSGLTLKDNNVDLKTVIHNYTNTSKTVTIQIKIKDGDAVVNTIEEDAVILANTLKSVQCKIQAIATANQNYKLEINIFDKQKNELLSTNTDALKKSEISYHSYLGNGTHNTTTRLNDVDNYSTYALIGNKINPVGAEIKGYTYRGSNVPVDGILVNQVNNPVNFYYTKNEGILHLIYKDENGVISSTQDKKIAYGETVVPQQSDVPQIDNYDIVFSDPVTYNGIDDVTITYQYKKQTKEVWVKAVDKSTGEMIARLSLGKKQVGETITLKAPTATQIYELSEYELADIEEKQIQLLNDKNDETITFFYNKKKVENPEPENPKPENPDNVPNSSIDPDSEHRVPSNSDIVLKTSFKPEEVTNTKLETENQQSINDIILTNTEFNIKLISKNTTITKDFELIVKKHNENSLVSNKKLNEMFTKYIAYDFELKSGGEIVELTDKVMLKIPIPNGYVKENMKIYYINDNGSKIEVSSYLEKDHILFETNYLTTFILSEEKVDENEEKIEDKIEDKTSNYSKDNINEEAEKQKGNIYPILIVAGVLVVIVIVVLIIRNKNKK